ncbi:hypothetical protein ACHHYP_04050 [Achlya hypogyna]|uniref:RING-type domain-containing protein n=1 Tax=Achlya hypogyna TaxID=1202772 RepID=A0A1V9Z2U3_ACHHY|nr:hypothetical protein ACHHYP_04050 [Achlya hypogyna]
MATHAQYAMSDDGMSGIGSGGRYTAANAKKRLVRKIQQDSLKQLALSTQAVLVRAPTNPYYSYHMTITSEYYKQKWIACHRYSEFYRLRKRLLDQLEVHMKMNCAYCKALHGQISKFDFPGRSPLFKKVEVNAQVVERTSGLEDFVVALCQYLSAEGITVHCKNILSIQVMTKDFLQFPLAHEEQHIRAIKSLTYVDPRDVRVDTESCPICLNDWGELDGNQLVLSLCGHFFHEHCINEWYTTRFDCPMCRQIAGI